MDEHDYGRWTRSPGDIPAETIEQLRTENHATSAQRYETAKRQRAERLNRARTAALPEAHQLLQRLQELNLAPECDAEDLVTVQTRPPAVAVECLLATVQLGPQHRPRCTWRVIAAGSRGEPRLHVETADPEWPHPRLYDLGVLTRERAARAIADPPVALDGAVRIDTAPPEAATPTPAERARQLLTELDTDPANHYGARGIALAQAWATLATAT